MQNDYWTFKGILMLASHKDSIAQSPHFYCGKAHNHPMSLSSIP
ncbi:hypothetical protein [uncultured Helicobacter sp.]|nr:hypothetical protein [uncultured Helicobacter sp.]